MSAFQHRSGTLEKRYVVETTGSGVALWTSIATGVSTSTW